MEKKEKTELKKGGAVYIIIILLLLLVGGWLGLEIRDGRKQNAACSQSVTNLQAEKDYLNDILKKTGIIEESDDETLKDNLTAILNEYDSLTFDNDEMLDSINKQKAHIQGLLDEVETLHNQKKKDWGKIYKLKKETETLREIMKGYIHTIDSLGTENTGLKNTIKDKNNQITDIKTDRDNIKDKNDLLIISYFAFLSLFTFPFYQEYLDPLFYILIFSFFKTRFEFENKKGTYLIVLYFFIFSLSSKYYYQITI